MKKIFYLLFLPLCLGVTACGGDDEDNTEKPNDPNTSNNEMPNSNGMKVAEAVDLGLSVKWASWNVGASAPEDFGNYYAWGEIEPKMFYQVVNYSLEEYRTYDNGSLPHYFRSSFPVDIAGKSKYDVATAKWGSGWAMPTKAQFEELLSKCSHGPMTSNGVKGEMFVGPNNKSIFLPYCGIRTNEDDRVGTLCITGLLPLKRLFLCIIPSMTEWYP